ncbi:ABC transporter substrate-binding protein, partial [Rothia sp. HMSC072B04]|uniref:ABC transporter substrate-binding protein n=2 Tax=Micrococcaceae TaxID=1268 RepID=UPI0008A2109B
MTTFTLNRRTLLTGTVALGTVGLLAACGGNSSKTESNALSAGDDLSKAVSYNEKDRSALKNGGELRLSADGIGPNFNILNTNGYTAGNLNIQAAINSSFTGGYYADFRGEGHMNEDYVTEYKAQTVDGVQTVTFKINPKAVFNDGTPIDVNAVKSYQTIYTAAASGSDYQITPSPIWEQVASVEAVDGDTRHVKVTMSKPWYPIEGSFTSFLHPAFVDVAFFNDGMNGKPLDQYWAGPFKVGEWNSSSKVLTVVRNEKWWGTQPLLERITWREMSSQAEQAAFKNNEIDYADASTLSSYNELSSVSNIDIRKGSALAVGNYEINPEKMPLPVRRAFVAALNRDQLLKLRYEKLGWKENLPGSMCMLPMQEGYQDNYPTKLGKDVATKILEDAGYTKNGDYYE